LLLYRYGDGQAAIRSAPIAGRAGVYSCRHAYCFGEIRHVSCQRCAGYRPVCRLLASINGAGVALPPGIGTTGGDRQCPSRRDPVSVRILKRGFESGCPAYMNGNAVTLPALG